MELNQTERRILQALQRDARKSVSSLARELALSRTTVQKHIARLEQNGVIAGYQLKLGEGYRASTFQAYVSLVLDPKLSAQVATALKRMAEVEALFTVSGKIDMVAIVRVQSPGELDRALDRIGELEGVRDTDSAIVLSTKFDRR